MHSSVGRVAVQILDRLAARARLIGGEAAPREREQALAQQLEALSNMRYGLRRVRRLYAVGVPLEISIAGVLVGAARTGAAAASSLGNGDEEERERGREHELWAKHGGPPQAWSHGAPPPPIRA